MSRYFINALAFGASGHHLSDALYPALSGEWEVPVTRNAGHRHPRLSPLSIPFVRKPQAATCGEALIDDEDDLVGRAELNPGNLHFDLQNNHGDESVHSKEVEPPATFV
jgi:hypothetical protein